MVTRREQGPALAAVNKWLRTLRAQRGVTIDPVLAVALADTATAVDRARAADKTGARLAYIARELRAARLDVLALVPIAAESDPFTELLAQIQMADAAHTRAAD